MSAELHHRCPECGDREHLYGRVDVRWNFERQEWVSGAMEDDFECTECDWSGSLEETMMEETDAPQSR